MTGFVHTCQDASNSSNKLKTTFISLYAVFMQCWQCSVLAPVLFIACVCLTRQLTDWLLQYQVPSVCWRHSAACHSGRSQLSPDRQSSIWVYSYLPWDIGCCTTIFCWIQTNSSDGTRHNLATPVCCCANLRGHWRHTNLKSDVAAHTNEMKFRWQNH